MGRNVVDLSLVVEIQKIKNSLYNKIDRGYKETVLQDEKKILFSFPLSKILIDPDSFQLPFLKMTKDE